MAMVLCLWRQIDVFHIVLSTEGFILNPVVWTNEGCYGQVDERLMFEMRLCIE